MINGALPNTPPGYQQNPLGYNVSEVGHTDWSAGINAKLAAEVAALPQVTRPAAVEFSIGENPAIELDRPYEAFDPNPGHHEVDTPLDIPPASIALGGLRGRVHELHMRLKLASNIADRVVYSGIASRNEHRAEGISAVANKLRTNPNSIPTLTTVGVKKPEQNFWRQRRALRTAKRELRDEGLSRLAIRRVIHHNREDNEIEVLDAKRLRGGIYRINPFNAKLRLRRRRYHTRSERAIPDETEMLINAGYRSLASESEQDIQAARNSGTRFAEDIANDNHERRTYPNRHMGFSKKGEPIWLKKQSSAIDYLQKKIEKNAIYASGSLIARAEITRSYQEGLAIHGRIADIRRRRAQILRSDADAVQMAAEGHYVRRRPLEILPRTHKKAERLRTKAQKIENRANNVPTSITPRFRNRAVAEIDKVTALRRVQAAPANTFPNTFVGGN